MSYRFLSISFLLVGAFLAGGPLWAKEDTAYLTFRKSAPSRPGLTVYTVKKGEWLLDIGRRVTGETKHVYTIIRKYNPGLKNLNLIYPGQKIILPVKGAATAPPAGTHPPATALAEQTGVLKDDRPHPTQVKWALVKQILGRIGATVTSEGKYYLPMRDMGQITIDCRKIPMVEFADRGIVFIDFRHQIPDNLRQLVRRTWKHYAIIRIDPQAEALTLLEQIIQASNTHTMIRPEQPTNIGSQPVLQIPGAWTINSKLPVQQASPPPAIALLTRPEGASGLPEPISAYAKANGWTIIEVVQDKIVSAAPETPIPVRPVAKFASTPLIALTDDCLRKLGFLTERNAGLKVFDAARDGFDLRVEADLLVRKGDQKFIFLSKKMPSQFLNILKSSGTEVIIVAEEETKKSMLEKSFQALKVPYEFNTFSFPVTGKSDQAGMTVSFPALKISMDKTNYLYLIDFDMDERMNSLLSDKMGILVVRY